MNGSPVTSSFPEVLMSQRTSAWRSRKAYGSIGLNGSPLQGWEHYGLPLDDINKLQFAGGASAGDTSAGGASARKPIAGPGFYRGTFTVAQTGYTFLDMRGWGKGYVWINGHNVGGIGASGRSSPCSCQRRGSK